LLILKGCGSFLNYWLLLSLNAARYNASGSISETVIFLDFRLYLEVPHVKRWGGTAVFRLGSLAEFFEAACY
jgi:hypothetical protein